MGQRQARKLLNLGFFIVYIFGRYWFSVPVTADASFLTLSLWNDMQQWDSRDPSLSACLLRKLSNHTWYLTGRHAVFSLFSRLIDNDTKAKIVSAMKDPENQARKIPPGKPSLQRISPEDTLDVFTDGEFWLLFERTKIQLTFFYLPVHEWENDTTFLKVKSFILSLHIQRRGGESCEAWL